ncbi:uncharacterized protein LOC101240704 [Hydra vulgaris]|uniref:uncharacterized protein LOC101240704 n=1 Tax=Hydra vulgaris TaxID=6087 RepID=UPI000640C634|nr:uncharacterized protein LOC101240704 [Hydra vulgaris]
MNINQDGSKEYVIYNNCNKIESEIKIEETDSQCTPQQINHHNTTTVQQINLFKQEITQDDDNCMPLNNLSSNPNKFKIVKRRRKNVNSIGSQLNEDHIRLLKRLLVDITLINDRGFLKTLHEQKFPRITSMSLRKQLLKWKNLINLSNNESSLVLRSSGKLILPVEKYKETILKAHRCEGEFTTTHKGHCNYFETKKQFKLKYTMGFSNFGPTTKLMRKVIGLCQDCSDVVTRGIVTQEKLPQPKNSDHSKSKHTQYCSKKVCASEKNLNINNQFTNTVDLSIEDIELDHPVFSEDLNDYPISMLYKNVKGSPWFNHKGVIQEKNFYKKMIEMIREIGIELGYAAQGNIRAIDRLSSKIAIASHILSLFKRDVSERKIDQERELEDFKIFQELFTSKNRMDLYIYDLNILARNDNTRHFAYLPIPNIPQILVTSGTNFDEVIEIADFL